MSKKNRWGIAAQFNPDDPEQSEVMKILNEWLEERRKSNKDYNPRMLITDMVWELIDNGAEPKQGDPVSRMQGLMMHQFNELKNMLSSGIGMFSVPQDTSYEEAYSDEVDDSVISAILSDHRAVGGR